MSSGSFFVYFSKRFSKFRHHIVPFYSYRFHIKNWGVFSLFILFFSYIFKNSIKISAKYFFFRYEFSEKRQRKRERRKNYDKSIMYFTLIILIYFLWRHKKVVIIMIQPEGNVSEWSVKADFYNKFSAHYKQEWERVCKKLCFLKKATNTNGED